MLLKLWSVRCRCCFCCGCEASGVVIGGSDGSTAASFVVAVVVSVVAVMGGDVGFGVNVFGGRGNVGIIVLILLSV